MKTIRILTLLIVGLGLLAWGFAALNTCLLPVELQDPNLGDSSRVFPSREGILLSTATGLYRQSLSGEFDTIHGLGSGKCANIANIFDTQQGVFVITGIGDCKSELYRFTAKKGLEPVLAEEAERQKFVRVEQTSDDVFVILTDAIYKLATGMSALQSLATADQCIIHDPGYTKTRSLIFFPAANGSLCKLGHRGLDLISGWTNDIFWGAAETSRGVFLWGRRGAYWLDENNHVGKIEGISDDPVILNVYEMSTEHRLGRV